MMVVLIPDELVMRLMILLDARGRPHTESHVREEAIAALYRQVEEMERAQSRHAEVVGQGR